MMDRVHHTVVFFAGKYGQNSQINRNLSDLYTAFKPSELFNVQ